MDKQEKEYTYRSLREERKYEMKLSSGFWAVLRPVLIALTVLVVVCGVLLTAWNKIYETYLAPVSAEPAEEILFEIASGDSLTRVSNRLEASGLIRNRTVFKYYCDFAGMGQKIQIGTYQLNPAMTMSEIADRLTTGDGNPLVRNITLIPGESVEDFAAKLAAGGVIGDQNAFLEKCRTGEMFKDYYYIADVLSTPGAARRKYVLEGYLAPNTYEVYTTASDEEIIRKLLSQVEAAFPEDYRNRAEELGMTMDEVLTLASLVEKEAKTADFEKVSAVFHNRLKKGMKLQSDVTVHYITGVLRMSLNEGDLNTDSPYNTYLHTGLPLGPVCNPSAAAVRAALFPEENYLNEGYLYFCAKTPESGELYFSKTLAEHETAVAIYSPTWKQYDESRGIAQ